MKQYILLDSGGTLTCRSSGKVTSGTVSIYDSTGTITSVSEDVLDDYGSSTATTVAAGVSQSDPRLINVLSGTGFNVGDTIKITDDGYGFTESHIIAGVGSKAIFVSDTLINDYDIGSVVETTEVSYAVASSVLTAIGSSCRARFTLDGVVSDIIFDVVNSPIIQPITVENLPEIDPTAAQQLPSSAMDWSKILELTWDKCIHYLTASGLYPKYIIDDEQLLLLHHAAFRWGLAEKGIEPQSSFIVGGAIGYFRSEFFSLLESIKISWLDVGQDLIPSSNELNKMKQTRVII